MKDDWLPIRHSLPTDIHVLRMAARLKTTPYEVVGLLVHFWSWVCSNSHDGHLSRFDRDILETHLPRPDLLDAMLAEGWLVLSDTVMVVPDFDLWMHRDALKRLKAKEKKREQRVNQDSPNPVPAAEGHLSQSCPPEKGTAVPILSREENTRGGTTGTVTVTVTDTVTELSTLAPSGDRAARPSEIVDNSTKPKRKKPKPKSTALEKQEPKPPSRFQMVVDHWCLTWKETRGKPYSFSAVDGAKIKAVLKKSENDVGDVCERIDRLLRTQTDAWLIANASPAILDSRYNQLGVTPPSADLVKNLDWRINAPVVKYPRKAGDVA